MKERRIAHSARMDFQILVERLDRDPREVKSLRILHNGQDVVDPFNWKEGDGPMEFDWLDSHYQVIVKRVTGNWITAEDAIFETIRDPLKAK